MSRSTQHKCSKPLELSELVAYRLGELDAPEQAQLEERYFECHGCAERLRWVEELSAEVIEVVRRGELRAAVTEQFVRQAKAAGLNIREYSIEPGGSVNCTLAPSDDFTVLRLGVGELTVTTVQVTSHMTDLEHGIDGSSVTQDAVVDRTSRAVFYAFPADVVRSFARSRWTMTVSPSGNGETSIGPYTMHHMPYQAARDADG